MYNLEVSQCHGKLKGFHEVLPKKVGNKDIKSTSLKIRPGFDFKNIGNVVLAS